MQSLRRSAGSSASKVRSSLLPKQPRRFASQGARDAHEAHAHHGPVNEPLGKGFYITIALVPATFAVYKFSRMNTSERPWFTRFVDSYSYYKDRWAARNDLHVKALEQSAADRNLFMNSKGSDTIDLRFPEIFNTGAPWNVPAGWGGANLDHLIKHYEKKNFEENARKLQALKEDNIKAEKMPTRPHPPEKEIFP